MDIQTKKLHFVQEFLRIKDEKLVDKLNAVLKTERKKKFDKELKLISKEEFNKIIDKAEEDSVSGRMTSAQELQNEVDSWS
ncbi:MAG: hypothetical protein KDC09_07170 [Bacteroidales bacterium]|nr:hypothetical protein [Bacteroidales bacterium]